ncbi:MAG: HAD-IA family hydrolase [Alphaproteobacteria bacterium]|nr:HAD-IA family hydrolase [Alphaproteobacteria bacterium]
MEADVDCLKKNQRKESVIIWDADGVLFETFVLDTQFRWSQNIKADLGIGGPLIKQIFSGDWEKVLRGEVEVLQHVETVFQRNDFSLSAETFVAYWLEKDNRINEGVAHYLDLFPSCIGSNQPRVRAERFDEWFKGRVMQVFASSRMGGLMKPEPDYYRYIEHALGFSPQQLCLIDDTQANVDGAIKHGWQAHHFVDTTGLSDFLENSNLLKKSADPTS